MIDLTMWVLADRDTVFTGTRGNVQLFPMKRQAQQWRKDNLLWGEYDRWKPKKVKVTDANKG